MIAILCWSLLISLALNGALFLLAFKLQSDKLTDASYALTFIALDIWAFTQSSDRVYDIVALALVGIWALRIGSFLLYRVLRAGKDRRFDNMRNSFWKFGKFWLGQAITVWILMLPMTLALPSSNSSKIPLLGIIIWLIGFALESIADAQKYHFNSDPAHTGQWIDTGLWQYARHPNYFGEILVWVGVYIYCFPELTFVGKIAGLSSPLVISALLLFISGVPILEKNADKRWGDNPAYQLYKRRTNLLIPIPRKIR